MSIKNAANDWIIWKECENMQKTRIIRKIEGEIAYYEIWGIDERFK